MTEIQTTQDLVARVLNKEYMQREGIIPHVDLAGEFLNESKHSEISKIEIYDVLRIHKKGNIDRYYVAILNHTNKKGENKIVKNYLGNNYPSEEDIKKLFYSHR